MVVFSNDHISDNINIYGKYALEELQFLETYIFPKLALGLVLDIGANIGNHSVFFADHFTSVMCFEPNPTTFQLLKINTAKDTNAKCFAFGASDNDATLQAEHNIQNIGASRITQDNNNMQKGLNAVEFTVKNLDAVLESEGAGKVDFIKIDVEGHELSALKGLSATLAKDKPVIAFESLEIGSAANDVPEFLKSQGYRHFYEMKSTHFLDTLPKFPRRITKMISLALGLSINPKFRPVLIESLTGSIHALVIASVDDIF